MGRRATFWLLGAAFVAGAAVSASGLGVMFPKMVSDAFAYRYGLSRIDGILRGQKADLEDKLYAWILTRQVDKVTKGLKTDREKALALATWVGTHWRNASNFKSVAATHGGSSWLDKAVWRTGACGTRTGIFVAMAEIAGLKVRRFSIYNFGHVGGGHTAAQVYWGGQWHYFDVTYAGYFEKGGVILSFQQVLDLADDALDYLVAFPSFGDVYGNSLDPSQWVRVDNRERMQKIYAPENLATTVSYGFVGAADPVTLRFPMSVGDTLGQIDDEYMDVFHAERKQKKSEQIERMGFTSVPFFERIDLDGMTTGESYSYRIDVAGQHLGKGSIFKAASDRCEITAGSTFDGSDVWSIDFVAKDEACTLSLTHNVRDSGRFFEVDRIAFYARGR